MIGEKESEAQTTNQTSLYHFIISSQNFPKELCIVVNVPRYILISEDDNDKHFLYMPDTYNQ